MNITTAVTAVKEHATNYGETALNNSNVRNFWSIKKLLRCHRKVASALVSGLSSIFFFTFLLYTPHSHMILPKLKC